MCPRCSNLYFYGRQIWLRLSGKWVDCGRLHLATYDSKTRVQQFNSVAPRGIAEVVRISEHSPCPINWDERLDRMVYPQAIKNGRLTPALVSHADSAGLSIQRSPLATSEELASAVTSFLGGKADRGWIGVVSISVKRLRTLRGEDGLCRYWAYDSGEMKNPAHGEIHSQWIKEEDKLELRSRLLKAFEEFPIIEPKAFRHGLVWALLSDEHRARPNPIGGR